MLKSEVARTKQQVTRNSAGTESESPARWTEDRIQSHPDRNGHLQAGFRRGAGDRPLRRTAQGQHSVTSPERTTGLQKLANRENQIFLALTIIIAVIAGLSAVLFTLAIQGTQHLLFGLSPSWTRLLLVPTLVSLFTGFLLARFFPVRAGAAFHKQKRHTTCRKDGSRPGFPSENSLQVPFAWDRDTRWDVKDRRFKLAPVSHPAIGRFFQLSPERAKSLVPVGAAAALAAAFNTPVAAVLFSLEEIIGDMNAPLIGTTVVASVTAVIVERSILGDEVLFRVPAYHLAHPAELIGYAVLGILGGLISVAFCKGLLRLRAFFLGLPARTVILQPAAGGLAAGIMLVFVPQVMGVGYQYVDQAMSGGLVLKVMILLCAAKARRNHHFICVWKCRGNICTQFVHRSHGGRRVWNFDAETRTFPDRRPGRLRTGRYGSAFRGHYPRANDVGVHDFRTHSRLPDPRPADGREHAQPSHLQTFPAEAGVSGAAGTNRHLSSRGLIFTTSTASRLRFRCKSCYRSTISCHDNCH